MKEKSSKAFELDDSLLDRVNGGTGIVMPAMSGDTKESSKAMPGMNNVPAANSMISAMILYVIGKGDCLSVLAQRYNTSVAMLQNVNQIADPDDIEPGTMIRIPCNQK